MQSRIFGSLCLCAAFGLAGCDDDSSELERATQDATVHGDASGFTEGDAGSEENEPKGEAYNAYVYLNEIRANPPAYSEACHVDLSGIEPRPQLQWNEALAKAAEAKAKDMCDRHYFDHVDPDGNGMNIKISEAGYSLNPSWYSDPSANYFESIAAGAVDGIDAIQMLIEDAGLTPPGHRNHLLGLTDWFADCYDIGIGFVEDCPNDMYHTYMSVLIAKHDF